MSQKAQTKQTAGRSVSKNTPGNPTNLKKRKNEKGRKRPRGARAPARTREIQLQISQCGLDYLHAVTDPWGFRNTGRYPCIPDLLDMPSKKFGTTVRGTFVIGAGGFGFVAFQPLLRAADIRIGVKSNTTTYAGSTIELTGAGTATILDQQFPWNDGTSASTRLVACGLRIRYTGREIERGGQMITAASSAAGVDFVGDGFDNFASQPDVPVQSCTRAWRGCIWRPLRPEQTQYTIVNSDTDSMFMCGIVNGTTGNTYEYELVRWFEAVTSDEVNVRDTSASHSDISGMSRVRDYLGQVSQSDFGQALYTRGLEYLKKQFIPMPLQLALEWQGNSGL